MPKNDTGGGSISVLAVVRHGIGLATDLYDLTIINAIRPQLEECYGPMSDSMNGAITSATCAGAMIGQLTFGYLADKIGRRTTFIATASLLCVAAAGSACATAVGGLHTYEVLLMWRFVLGIGVGGEYPLSMAVTAEEASAENSARSMAATYSMFQVGQLLAPVVVLCCLYADASAELTWRLSLGVGSILALVGALLRAETMHESEAWKMSRTSSGSSKVCCSRATLKAIGYPLAGTMSTYFVYDVVSWGVGSYTSTIFEASSRKQTIWFMLLINLMATPGFVLTLWMDRFGRKFYQMAGFVGMALCLLIVGASWGHAAQLLLVIVFGIQKIFDSAGPGATTFIIPGEIFPTAVRGTCHGISSASGKLGAFVGMYFFPVVQRAIGFNGVLLLGGLLMLVGFVLTLVFTPPYTAETLSRLAAATKDDLSSTTAVLWSREQRAPAEDKSLSALCDQELDESASSGGESSASHAS
ncbi:unnamed protein product [Polarella glacialis]|uniref:Major facilitator superfamily (MFS) profile domain-containing protein n=1 Tax=Polarella glacialis TaxID=89957 RepID=A0A813JTZ7_POLGL|nr:unnamed protein product [Polarella glacialis]